MRPPESSRLPRAAAGAILCAQMKRDTPHSPPRVITGTAPVRVCDNGGWTDTWFARHGKVFNIAVRPHVEVQVEVRRRGRHEPHVVVNAENLSDSDGGG